MHISSSFDSGNIEYLDQDTAQDADQADQAVFRLAIRKDNASDFYQWFHFRLTGAAGQDCRLVIENAGDSAYAEGWEHYQAVASYDRREWFRVPTTYQDGHLSIRHTPEFDSVYYAYFAPYTTERHADLLADVIQSPLVAYTNLGHTLDGQDMDLLRIGHHADKQLNMWVIARQHPGETMAEWWMEGFLYRLLDEDDPVARALLDRAVFHVVPNMNPDGGRRGHLRTNAAGANLNREWADPAMDRSPEVFLVRERMHRTGVDFCMDVHGDEALPHNFIAGAEGIEGWNQRLAALQADFQQALVQASPDFQTEHGYDLDPPGSSDLRKNTDYMAQTFDCLAMTLEMPFKDTTTTALPETGWSPRRCRLLGEACLDAMLAVVDKLR